MSDARTRNEGQETRGRDIGDERSRGRETRGRHETGGIADVILGRLVVCVIVIYWREYF